MNELMVQVEKAVRPVRTGDAGKNRMREEMLAHLTNIYDEEFARLKDKPLALSAAFARFGPPAKLTAELNASVNWQGRCAYHSDRWFAWHATESAGRYTFRVSFNLCLLFLVGFSPILLANLLLNHKPVFESLIAYCWLGIVCFLICSAIFPFGWLYFKIRDSLLGFNVPKSPWRVATYGCAVAVGLLAYEWALSFVLTEEAFSDLFRTSIVTSGIVAVLAPFALILAARYNGPKEIRHTVWCCLEIAE